MIEEYVGDLGMFRYDNEVFKLYEVNGVEWLYYIGKETDGSKIEIPKGIRNCMCMFGNTKIESAPRIPDGVWSCRYMFSNTGITSASRIPDGVIDTTGMFDNCYRLIVAPEMPDSVKQYANMFTGCYRLSELPTFFNNHNAEFYRLMLLEETPKTWDAAGKKDVSLPLLFNKAKQKNGRAIRMLKTCAERCWKEVESSRDAKAAIRNDALFGCTFTYAAMLELLCTDKMSPYLGFEDMFLEQNIIEYSEYQYLLPLDGTRAQIIKEDFLTKDQVEQIVRILNKMYEKIVEGLEKLKQVLFERE